MRQRPLILSLQGIKLGGYEARAFYGIGVDLKGEVQYGDHLSRSNLRRSLKYREQMNSSPLSDLKGEKDMEFEAEGSKGFNASPEGLELDCSVYQQSDSEKVADGELARSANGSVGSCWHLEYLELVRAVAERWQ